jgi:glucose-6-phosphate dehydrogenase assembly protein OpcA
MRLTLDQVERELARLWDTDGRAAGGSRAELMTLVALVSEPRLLERAQRAVSEVVVSHPSRTIVALWHDGDVPSLTAEVALHKPPGCPAVCGDAITLDAVGGARDWLPGNAERLALADLPVCVWWVGDLPDYDDLFDRMVVGADVVIVNSGEMDLRDLEKLSSIAARSRGHYAVADLTWTRQRLLQDLVARFFDDAEGEACIRDLQRITIEFVPRPEEKDAASPQAALLFGWMAHVLGLPTDGVRWTRGEGWSEAKVGSVVGRFEHSSRRNLRSGVITRVAMDAGKAQFQIVRQDDPRVYQWSRDVPGVATAPHTVRVSPFDEGLLLARSIERPKRDPLLEASLQAGSRIVRPIAPRLSVAPPPTR